MRKGGGGIGGVGGEPCVHGYSMSSDSMLPMENLFLETLRLLQPKHSQGLHSEFCYSIGSSFHSNVHLNSKGVV